MGDVTSPTRKRPTHLWWWAASLVLVAGGFAGIIYATHSGPAVGPSLARPFGQTSIAPPTGTPTTSTTTVPVPTSTTTLSAGTTAPPYATAATTVALTERSTSSGVVTIKPVGRSRPVHLAIPALRISVRLSELGLNKDKSVQVPSSFTVPGWYKYGPTPGQLGSAVILGHVDSYQGPGVFAHLADLKYGNRIYVKAANGKIRIFAVIGMREYLKSNFPDRLVYGPRKYAALQLVTCGGVFDRQTGHYLSNIVVFTALVKR
ncbi:MAG: class F sortase [Acidobacteriota bacterium]|nr:class F sortase [Acidobacteriota bacterium]